MGRQRPDGAHSLLLAPLQHLARFKGRQSVLQGLLEGHFTATEAVVPG